MSNHRCKFKMKYILKDNEGFDVIKEDKTIDIYQSSEDLRNAIDIIYDSLANLAFIGDKPNLPWRDNINQYIQDGLVFHLDGINKGGVDNQWTDLIGGVDFPNHGAIELENGWQFDGTGYLGYANDATKSLPFIAGNCTVEIAFYDNMINQQVGTVNAGMTLFFFGANSVTGSNDTNCVYLAYDYAYNEKYINGMYVGNTTNVWADSLIETLAPHTLSINKDRAFDNELALTSLGKNHWDSISGGRTIGAKQHPSAGLGNFAIGKIFAIRIYNRILTETEMRHNQNIDNNRFNLGLTIPN